MYGTNHLHTQNKLFIVWNKLFTPLEQVISDIEQIMQTRNKLVSAWNKSFELSKPIISSVKQIICVLRTNWLDSSWIECYGMLTVTYVLFKKLMNYGWQHVPHYELYNKYVVKLKTHNKKMNLTNAKSYVWSEQTNVCGTLFRSPEKNSYA